MKRFLTFAVVLIGLISCTASEIQLTVTPGEEVVPTAVSQADMPNPAAVFCEEQGSQSEIRTAEDGGQYGVCIFPDGGECDEWAFYRGECSPTGVSTDTPAATGFPTALPVDQSLYQSWQHYSNAVYGFSLMLPEDWVVEEIDPSDPLLGGHLVDIHPRASDGKENIRLTFRHAGEETLLWPTGVGQGEFLPQGTLEVAGRAAQRMLLVCPTGEITSIWYHQGEGEPNIARGDMEFGIIYSAGAHCEPGLSLGGEAQLVGEMIIASLKIL